MKRLRNLFLAMVLLTLVNGSLLAQSNYTVDVDQQVVGSDLIMDLYIQKTSGADFALSSCNFAVVVDTAALDLLNASKDANFDGPWDTDTDPTSYLDILLGRGADFFNVNVLRRVNGSGSGQMVTSTRTQITRVVLPIKDACVSNSSTWVVYQAAQNKFPLINIKPYANFVNPSTIPLCEAPQVPTISANGNDTICEGDVTLLSSSHTGDVQWYLNGQAIQGATGSTYGAGVSGLYTVEAINCMCRTISVDQFSLIVNPLPVVPDINLVGSLLSTTSTENIQWYLNGEVIEGATFQTYEPTTSGNYSIGVSNNCGEQLSDVIEITLTSIEETLISRFEAVPNPYIGETTISYSVIEPGEVSISVYNLLGDKISEISNEHMSTGEYSFQFSGNDYNLSEGVYLLKLNINDKTKTLKLLELK